MLKSTILWLFKLKNLSSGVLVFQDCQYYLYTNLRNLILKKKKKKKKKKLPNFKVKSDNAIVHPTSYNSIYILIKV